MQDKNSDTLNITENSPLSFRADLSKGKARERIEKILESLSITEYSFANGFLQIDKNASFVIPNRDLTKAESSIVNMLLCSVPVECAEV